MLGSRASLIQDCPVRYFGIVDVLKTDASTPPKIDNVLQTMSKRKKAFKNFDCLVSCSDEGVAVSNQKSRGLVAMWDAACIKLCASIAYPGKKGQCITLLQVADPETGSLSWHIFTYSDAMRDQMVKAFQAVMRQPTLQSMLDHTFRTLSDDDIISWLEEVMQASVADSMAQEAASLAYQDESRAYKLSPPAKFDRKLNPTMSGSSQEANSMSSRRPQSFATLSTI
eukprot:m.460225 g.460225  ORF g.460225 m.460225 type:complete len:226 (+) comp21971_c0_seq1:827-1504(+)